MTINDCRLHYSSTGRLKSNPNKDIALLVVVNGRDEWMQLLPIGLLVAEALAVVAVADMMEVRALLWCVLLVLVFDLAVAVEDEHGLTKCQLAVIALSLLAAVDSDWSDDDVRAVVRRRRSVAERVKPRDRVRRSVEC